MAFAGAWIEAAMGYVSRMWLSLVRFDFLLACYDWCAASQKDRDRASVLFGDQLKAKWVVAVD